MIIRCLHHLLPPREGGKEVIISHPNSLLHKEGSHAPVSCDNSQYSVGSACFIPSPNSNRKRPVSPICLHRHVWHSCTLWTARFKPRSSFWATLRALWRSRTDDYHSQHLLTHAIWRDQLVGSHLAKDNLPAVTSKPSPAKCSTAALKASQEGGIAVLPLQATALLSEVKGQLPPATRSSKSRTGGFTLWP